MLNKFLKLKENFNKSNIIKKLKEIKSQLSKSLVQTGGGVSLNNSFTQKILDCLTNNNPVQKKPDAERREAERIAAEKAEAEIAAAEKAAAEKAVCARTRTSRSAVWKTATTRSAPSAS